MMLAVAVLFFQISPVAQVLPVETPAQSPAPVAASSNPAPQPLFARNAAAASSNVPANTAPVNSLTKPSADSLHADSVYTPGENSLAIIHSPEPPLGKPVHYDAETLPSRKKWLILALAEHGAAAFDAYATRDAISHGAHESDPFLRPVANSNGIYAVIQICPLLLDYTSHKMQRSPNNFERHTWWMPQSVGTVVYLLSGVHDLQVAK